MAKAAAAGDGSAHSRDISAGGTTAPRRPMVRWIKREKEVHAKCPSAAWLSTAAGHKDLGRSGQGTNKTPPSRVVRRDPGEAVSACL